VEKGVAVCGSGVGACIAANKVRGARACLVAEIFSARQGVEDDDMNIACLGGRVVGPGLAWKLVEAFVEAKYIGGGRFQRRLDKVIALEGARHNITANAICPGYVWTPLVEHQIPDTAKARGITEDEVVTDVMLAEQPNKKFASDEQIGSLCVYLCSEQASSITGTALSIDGGWFAH